MMELTGKTAIVTGGASGLGREITFTLLAHQAIVFVLDIDKEALDLLEHESLKKIHCDITKQVEVAEAITTISKQVKKIDILINNAGILHSEPLVNIMSEERRHRLDTWQKVLEVNLTAPFLLGSYVAEQMIIKRSKGVIINISSVCAKGNKGQTAYSAAKAGLESMTKVWSKELGGFGIRCVAISPGFMETASTHQALTQSHIDEMKAQTSLRRLGGLSNIAHAVLFVITNNFITGTILHVNGGVVI